MNLLLDTHIFIWYLEGNECLSKKVLSYIRSLDNNIFISIASLWEISIKLKIGKLNLKYALKDLLNIIEENDMNLLGITFDDIIKNNSLELFHKDPFDRMIISQAVNNNLKLVSMDDNISKYNIDIIR